MVKSFPVKPDLNNTAIHYISVLSIQGFPVAQMVENLPAMQEAQVQSLGREDPLEKEWQPTPVFLPGESHGQRSLVGYNLWGHKERRLKQLSMYHACMQGLSSLDLKYIYIFGVTNIYSMDTFY